MNEQYEKQNEEIVNVEQLQSYTEHDYMYEITLMELQTISIDAIKKIVHFNSDTEMTSILVEATNKVLNVNEQLGNLFTGTCDITDITDIINHHVNLISDDKVAKVVKYYYDYKVISQYDKYGFISVCIFLARCSCLLDEVI